MTFARHASLASCVLFLVACGSSASPAPSIGSAPVADSGATPPPAVPAGESHAPEVVDASPPRAPGPAFTIQSETLETDTAGAPAGQSPSYTADIDATNPDGGKASMLLESKPGATSTTFAATTATRGIDGTIAGRRYRMRARIKTEDATAAWLWWRIDGPGFFQLDNMGKPVDRRIKGTNDWQEVSLVMDVPEAATGFAFGSGLSGQGKVWVGAMTFEEVGADVPTTPSFDYEW